MPPTSASAGRRAPDRRAPAARRPVWTPADIWTPDGWDPDAPGPGGCERLSAKQERVRARLAAGGRLSALPAGHEWRLHEPGEPPVPAGGARLHHTLGRGLLRRGLLREVPWDGGDAGTGRRLYALVLLPEESANGQLGDGRR